MSYSRASKWAPTSCFCRLTSISHWGHPLVLVGIKSFLWLNLAQRDIDADYSFIKHGLILKLLPYAFSWHPCVPGTLRLVPIIPMFKCVNWFPSVIVPTVVSGTTGPKLRGLANPASPVPRWTVPFVVLSSAASAHTGSTSNAAKISPIVGSTRWVIFEFVFHYLKWSCPLKF